MKGASFAKSHPTVRRPAFKVGDTVTLMRAESRCYVLVVKVIDGGERHRVDVRYCGRVLHFEWKKSARAYLCKSFVGRLDAFPGPA